MRLGQSEPLDQETLVVSDSEFNCNKHNLDLHENGLDPYKNDLKCDESAFIVTDLRLQLQQAKANTAQSISIQTSCRRIPCLLYFHDVQSGKFISFWVCTLLLCV
jgi:hypothetical protein